MSAETCPHCPAMVSISAIKCEACQRPLEYPNVRYALRLEETTAFRTRLGQAETAAEVAGTAEVLEEFRLAAAESSVAVMNRFLAPLHTWMISDNQLYKNFYWQVESGRVATDDEWNRQRIAAENAVSPVFFEDLSVAALTLDETGLTYYGPYAVVLRTEYIEYRASVFEENPFLFNERFGVLAGKDAPAGYRQVWASRGDLAVAKLQPKVHADTKAEQFANILMGADRNSDRCDFIEVHVYGGIHTSAIAKIVGPVPSEEIEAALWKHIKQKAAILNADVLEVEL